MNFEIIDNTFQILVLMLAMTGSIVTACRKKNRFFLFLAGGYGCFVMGTLYYMLYLIINGKVPQVFYVAEIAWLAAYLFFLSLSLSRYKMRHSFPGVLPVAAMLITMAVILSFRILGPSLIFSFCFAVIQGILVLRSTESLIIKKQGRLLDGLMVAVVWLQSTLYIVSIFVKDYRSFNLYFAVDILLTLMLAAMLPVLGKEVDL